MTLDCSAIAAYVCNYELDQVTFRNNLAALNGGAIEYTFYQPVATEVVYEGNRALYGQNVASYPTSMAWDGPSEVTDDAS